MHDLVKDYYGRQSQSTVDLRTSACCDASQMPEWLKPLLARIHPEVMSRCYGCGLVSPAAAGGRVFSMERTVKPSFLTGRLQQNCSKKNLRDSR
jgi:hypothetical protein